MNPHDNSATDAVEGSMLTREMRDSGDWLTEKATLVATGFSRNWLRELRRKRSVRALPESRGPGGQARTYWYFRNDVEGIVARRSAGATTTTSRVRAAKTDGDAYILGELELAMAKSDAKELELALARAEAQVIIARLEGELALVRAQFAELEVKYQRTLAALGAVTGLTTAP